MTPETIKTALVQALTENQQWSGRPVPEIHDDTCPIGGLPGFDSLSAIEIAVALSNSLGCEVDHTHFLPPGRPPLQVHEIVDTIYRTAQRSGDQHDSE